MTSVDAARVDAHHHYFRPGVGEYPWMDAPGFEFLRGEFGPDQLAPELAANSITATVLVQTWSSFEESLDYLAIAESSPHVRGVVAWVDLTAVDVDERLAELRDAPGGGRLVGVRHQVHDEPDPDWLSRPDVRRGLRAVAEADLVYDLLVRPRELPAALQLAHDLPDLRLVVDHAAKPNIAAGGRGAWLEALTPLARLAQVDCKLSGLVTEADRSSWDVDDVASYAVDVLAAPGAWPGVEHVLGAGADTALLLGADDAAGAVFRYDLALGVLEVLPGLRRDAAAPFVLLP